MRVPVLLELVLELELAPTAPTPIVLKLAPTRTRTPPLAGEPPKVKAPGGGGRGLGRRRGRGIVRRRERRVVRRGKRRRGVAPSFRRAHDRVRGGVARALHLHLHLPP
ncbi:hypothetical protein B0H11DRAFT_2017016 [Mycena galericulata]|nr:hypothetical protein B0H11DRAFT_2017016 [Mycena galericulata]